MRSNEISFVCPARNNIQYLGWSYNSIRKNLGKEIPICIADDFSNDNTSQWIIAKKKDDKFLSAIRNNGPTRLGHCILYDEIVKRLVQTQYFIIWHCDMFATKNMLDNMLKYINENSVVSATRIEPEGLHPVGPEKILYKCGYEPENIVEGDFNIFVDKLEEENKNKITNGVFAPWIMNKEKFLEMGGHDWLMSPQSREDSDFFNRLLLADFNLIQARDAFCLHLTCRGSRFQPQLTEIGKASDEWLAQNKRSEINFYRKWHQFIHHDATMKPIVEPVFDIAFIVKNCNLSDLYYLEPKCSNIYIDSKDIIEKYIEREQENTRLDLRVRVRYIDDFYHRINDFVLSFDADDFDRTYIENLGHLLSSYITSNSIEENCDYQFGQFRLRVKKIQSREKELITIDNKKYNIDLNIEQL